MSKAAAKKLLADYLGDQGVVLVVEPSGNYRTSLKQFFANLKVKNLRLVNSVADARREMLTSRISFFIAEWALDGTNGLQFCRSVRHEPGYKDTPFLLLSTESLRQDVILASEVAVDGYLIKPFSFEAFCAQLELILRNRTTPSLLNKIIDRADARFARGDLENAERDYAEALTIRTTSARALCGMANIARLRGDAKLAVKHLQTATTANPEYIEGYRVLMEIQEEQEDRIGMIQTAGILHSLSPENPRYTLILARLYLETRQLEGSEKFFKRTVALSPRLAEAYKGLGNVYMAKEDYERAMKNFRKALDLDKDDVSSLNSLGLAHVRLGQYKEGIEKYMIALKLDPNDFRVLFNLGHAYEKRGNAERAKWYYTQSLVRKPHYEKAIRGLERLGKDLGDDGEPPAGGGADDDAA